MSDIFDRMNKIDMTPQWSRDLDEAIELLYEERLNEWESDFIADLEERKLQKTLRGLTQRQNNALQKILEKYL